MMRVVLMSHEAFVADLSGLGRHAFKHVVLDAAQQILPKTLEVAQSLWGKPSVLLLIGVANLDSQCDGY